MNAIELTVSRLLVAAGVNLILGTIAWRAGAVSRGGYFGGMIVGTWILWFGGAGSYAVLLAFFILGSGATRWGYARKAAAGIAQESGGRRGSRHALANCGAAVALATTLPFWPSWAPAAGLVAAFATAVGDTLGSELGQLYGRTPVLLTSLKRVPPGTEGAVSVEGTVAGVLGSAALAALGAAVGLLPWSLAWVPLAAAIAGTLVESYVGALVGEKRLGNEFMNFMNTVVGAAVAMLIIALLPGAGPPTAP